MSIGFFTLHHIEDVVFFSLTEYYSLGPSIPFLFLSYSIHVKDSFNGKEATRMATLYYWAPCNDQSLGPVVSVMSNATTNGTYISMYTKGSPMATGQLWEVLGYGVAYYMRPYNCTAPPTSVLDMDNGVGNYTHLWEYYPNTNQLFDFWPITLAGVDYNYIRRFDDGTYLCYEGCNNGDHLYSSSQIGFSNTSYFRWYVYVGGRAPGAPKSVSADFIKKNATRVPDKLSRPMPTPAALERLYAAVRKARIAVTGKPAPKLLTGTKTAPAAPSASLLEAKPKSKAKAKPTAGKKQAKKVTAKKGKKPSAKKPALKKAPAAKKKKVAAKQRKSKQPSTKKAAKKVSPKGKKVKK
jgi:hypothetical protein